CTLDAVDAHRNTALVSPAPRPSATAPSSVRDDLAARAVYSEAAGISRAIPRAVSVPASADDVIAVVRWAREASLTLVPRGSGSGMAGGAVGDGVIVDVSRIKSLRVDADARLAFVGPGLTRAALDHAARRAGLWLPVDPSSGAFCSLGGMVATNAAGPRSLKHGAMRSWVKELTCVFADGTTARVRRDASLDAAVPPPALGRFLAQASALRERAARLPAPTTRKDSSGYGWHDFAKSGDVVDLLVGSEGSLAIFSEIAVRLVPVPNASATVLAAFASLESAVAGAALARTAGAAACELLDRTFLDVAAVDRPLPVDATSEAVLLIELDADDDKDAALAARSLGSALQPLAPVSMLLGVDSESADALWSLRYSVSPILQRLPSTTQSMQFIEDCAVPPDALPAFVRALRSALERHNRRGVIFGHAGDAHVHVNPLVDITQPNWRQTVTSLLDEVIELTAQFGGTLSGEHGDGRLRTPLLHRVRPPEELELARTLKEIFDPDGLMNPGVKVPLPGQVPLGDIKYDPELPPLPDAARRALDKVAIERAYDRSRLELLDEAN
ncbi:MAG: FAD-binding oxidoreductase, partial [Gemmatimonadaceae bacterium]